MLPCHIQQLIKAFSKTFSDLRSWNWLVNSWIISQQFSSLMKHISAYYESYSVLGSSFAKTNTKQIQSWGYIFTREIYTTPYDTLNDSKEGILNFIKPRSGKAQYKRNPHICQSRNTLQYTLCHFKSLSLLMLFLLLEMLHLPWLFW